MESTNAVAAPVTVFVAPGPGEETAATETFADLDGQAIGEWARSELAARAKSGEISARTAWKYYRYVSAYLSYCSGWEYMAGNPAETEIAQSTMPSRESGDSSDQQFWSPEQRATLMQHVEQRAYEAIDEYGDGRAAYEAFRDRALCALLGYSGVRGAELLNSPHDDREGRSGATWAAVDMANQKLRVLGKSQDREDVPTTGIPVEPLDRWKHLLDPPSDEWPIFPSFHTPTLWRAAREQLSAAGFSDDEIDELCEGYGDPLRLFDELGAALSRLDVDAVILAGPGFTKEDARDHIESEYPEVAERTTVVDTSAVGDRGVHEVLKRGAVDEVQTQTRISREAELIDDLTAGIATGEKVSYGIEAVAEAAEFGAVETLLILDDRLRKERQGDGDWDLDVNDVIQSVERQGGEVTVFSGEFDPGRQLRNLGGIAALLRYRLQ